MAKSYRPTDLMNSESATLSEKFNDFINENGASKDALIGFFGMMNPYYIAQYGKNKDFSDDVKNELVEFYDFFCRILPDMVEEMDDAWENVGGPVIFKLARAYKDWVEPDIDIISAELPDGQTIYVEAANADALDTYLSHLNRTGADSVEAITTDLHNMTENEFKAIKSPSKQFS